MESEYMYSKWVDIDNTLEFRCFVYNGVLRAISNIQFI